MSEWNIADDIKKLRADCPALAELSDAAVEGVYSWWSEEEYCAGWLCLGEDNREFREWLTAPTPKRDA